MFGSSSSGAEYSVPPPADRSELELRRWCIEQALNETKAFYIGQDTSDLIGRATKILNWVKES